MNTPESELTQNEVEEIAKGIYDGTIFTNAHLNDPNDTTLQSSVFVGLSFEDEESIEGKEDHTLIYQHLEKKIGETTGPDGQVYPTFMSYESVNRTDHSRIIDLYRELKSSTSEEKH